MTLGMYGIVAELVSVPSWYLWWCWAERCWRQGNRQGSGQRGCDTDAAAEVVAAEGRRRLTGVEAHLAAKRHATGHGVPPLWTARPSPEVILSWLAIVRIPPLPMLKGLSPNE